MPCLRLFSGAGAGHFHVWCLRAWDRFLGIQGWVKGYEDGIKREGWRAQAHLRRRGLFVTLVSSCQEPELGPG